MEVLEAEGIFGGDGAKSGGNGISATPGNDMEKEGGGGAWRGGM